MQRILSRAKQIKPKHAALFVVAAAAVAAIVYFAGREAQVDQRVEAGAAVTQERPAEPPQQGDGDQSGGEGGTVAPLTLTLTASRRICETAQAQGYYGSQQWQDDEGNWQSEDYSAGWFGVAETPITWSVAGGTAPYTLVVDGETRDAEQSYAGPSGTASVSCAMSPGETFVEDEEGRGYHAQPEVDSGLKTIHATVTDGAGATASASVQVYVILELPGSDGILQRGKTYRVFGHLITAPTGYDVRVGSVTEPACGAPSPGVRCGPEFSLILVGTGALISLFMSDGAEGVRRYRDGGVRGADAVDAAFDALADSVNRLPSVERDDP